ncbi:MAG: TIM barrel protein [Bacilli bacterium]|nr:TIM barrel protein [Bacilli bacterium]
MKIGMPQLFEYDNIEDNLILARELNLDFIELNLNFSSLRKAMEEKKLDCLLSKYNIASTLHFYDEADFGSYDEVVDAYLTLLKRYIKLGKGYIKNLNVHLIPGPVVTISGVKHYVYEKEYDEYIKRLINNLRKAEAICNKYDIQLVLENTDIIPKFMLKVYNGLKKEGFKFCYDIGHDYLSKNVLFNYLIDNDLPFKEFHIHDYKDNKCHLALNEGILNLNDFKDLIKKNDSYVVLEVKNKEDLVKSVPIFKEFIK